MRASLHLYRQRREESAKPCRADERHLKFEAFAKLPAAAASSYTVTRMNARDDDRLLQAMLDEDEKLATRAYLRSPEGYMFHPRVAGVSARKFWPLAQMRMHEQVRKPCRYTAFFFLLLECACTPESLVKLDWDDIDVASGTVFLQVSTSETFRPVGVSEFLCQVLGGLPRVSSRPFNFDIRHVKRVWSRISTRARLGFLTLEELQAEGAWRQLEVMRAASFVVRPPESPEDIAPGHSAVDDMSTLQAELGRFVSSLPSRGAAD